MTKEIKNREREAIEVPFTQGEFDQLTDALSNQPEWDLSDESVKEDMRFRNIVPLEKMKRENKRTFFGVFWASYSGHAYKNTDRGTIPANSVSLRPFHFLLYLSESGRIYLGCQYLGQFGGYSAMQRILRSLFKLDEGVVRAHSFQIGMGASANVQAKEVRVSISSKSKKITDPNSFTTSTAIALKKASRQDDFENKVSQKLLPLAGKPKRQIRKALAQILNDNGLTSVADDEVEDCSIVATVNGRRKMLYLLGAEGGFASKFPIDVPVNGDGHPEYEHTKRAMIEALQQEIIARKENV